MRCPQRVYRSGWNTLFINAKFSEYEPPFLRYLLPTTRELNEYICWQSRHACTPNNNCKIQGRFHRVLCCCNCQRCTVTKLLLSKIVICTFGVIFGIEITTRVTPEEF